MAQCGVGDGRRPGAEHKCGGRGERVARGGERSVKKGTDGEGGGAGDTETR